MKKKIIIRIAASLVGVTFLLFVVLCVHLYGIAKKRDAEKGNLTQLSRIDFKEPIDSVNALKINNFVGSMPEVKGTYFNIPAGLLVYGYAPGALKSQEVFDKVMNFTAHKYKAERYIVSPEQMNTGCPAGMDNSFSMGLANLLFKIFN
ncbi:MAG: hypothetical protein JWM14_2863 [Chitinophagaceae bacterium]|nr:hypothetical protein [Chitinophagaceae bacterium]